ncbi:unnamed protein product, partial [Symbiodinium sp. CCMP2592]
MADWVAADWQETLACFGGDHWWATWYFGQAIAKGCCRQFRHFGVWVSWSWQRFASCALNQPLKHTRRFVVERAKGSPSPRQWKLEEDDLGQPKLNLVDSLERDDFYDQSQCQVSDLDALIPARRVIVHEFFMTNGKFLDARQGDQFCTRRTGRLVTKKEGKDKFFLASDDGFLMYLNGEKVVDTNGCRGEQEKGSGDNFLKPGAYEIVEHMCEKGGGEVLKMHWKGPDGGNSTVKIPAGVLKHKKPKLNLVDCFELDYFYDQSLCEAPDLGALIPARRVIVHEIFMTNGKFPDARQGDQFCTRRTGRLVTKKEGKDKFFLASDDGFLMYVNGEKVVDNNGCRREQEKGSGDKFLKPGAHEIVVHMCEKGGGEVLKMHWKGPDGGNSKVKIPAGVLTHEKDVPVDQYVQGKTCNKFRWFTKGSSWPSGKADVLGDCFGTCDDGDKVCFQSLPKAYKEAGDDADTTEYTAMQKSSAGSSCHVRPSLAGEISPGERFGASDADAGRGLVDLDPVVGRQRGEELLSMLRGGPVSKGAGHSGQDLVQTPKAKAPAKGVPTPPPKAPAKGVATPPPKAPAKGVATPPPKAPAKGVATPPPK